MPFLSASGVSPYNKIRGGGASGSVILPFAFGNALRKDGTNDYVSHNSTPAVIDYSNPFTISMWYRPIDNTTNQRFFVIKNTTSNGIVSGLSTGDYANLYFINNASPNARHKVTFSFSINVWYHIVYTYNGSGFATRANYKIYINGVSQTLNSCNVFSVGPGTGIELGRQFNGGAQGEADTDEFALWNNAELSASQVSDLYNGGSGEYANKVESSGLYCYWRLNETSGDSIAVDETLNGNDGTLNNFDTSTCWVEHTRSDVDSDAQTFITAHETDTGVSMNVIQQAAINGFVTRLKGMGTTNSTNFWSGAFNVTSIYPYCPSNDSTASAAGYKLDLLRVNDITYTNFIAGDFTPTGATGGAGKIANTGIGIDAAAYNDYMISFYSRDLSASGRVMGALNAAATRALDPAFTGATTYNNFYRNTGSSSDAITNTQGLFTESQNKQYRNTTQFGTRQSANFLLDNKDIFLHSRNFNGAPNAPISNEFAGFAVGTKNFTAAAIQDWFECWDWYQTNVITGGRNV